ncbi:MAG TPA: hypothetical protein ENJ00_07080 [Phycisphaerales bacterium]|nr:hypothetical protein [Phycisphaerales bacterium]
MRKHPILSIFAGFFLVILLWIGYEVTLALTAQPSPTVDYGRILEDRVREIQADAEGEDAWPDLIEAGELHTKLLERMNNDVISRLRYEANNYNAYFNSDALRQKILDKDEGEFILRTREEELAEIDDLKLRAIEIVKQWEGSGILTRLDRIAESGKAVRPMPDSTKERLFEFELPELGQIRQLARGSIIRMDLARSSGDWTEYTRSFEHILALGRVAMQQSTLIDRLVGLSVRAMGYKALVADITGDRIPAEVLPDIQAAIDRQSAIPPMRYAVKNTMLLDLDIVQWMYSSHGRLLVNRLNELDWSGGPTHPIVNVASIAYPRKAETQRWFEDYFGKLQILFDTPPKQRRTMGLDIPDETNVSSWRYPVQQALLPALGRSSSRDDRTHQMRIAVRTIIAIARFKADTGSLPTSLDDLIPTYLDELPVDWYSEGLAPLKYKVLDEPDEFGRDYLLYSVWRDGVDDDGNTINNDPYVQSAGRNEGYDIVLNHPDLNQ